MRKGCTVLIVIMVMITILTGFVWPDHLASFQGADYEKTRKLWLQDPPLTGTDVVELQERLRELGFYQGIIDGIYDQEVEIAVKDFQIDNGLNPNGIVQDYLWI